MSDPDSSAPNELAHGTTTVEADYFQFHVAEPDTIEITTPDLLNGLVATAGDGAMIGTGVKMAAISVEVSVRASAPADPTPTELALWDEIIDISVTSTSGVLLVTPLFADESPPPGLPNLCTAGPGHYRLRVHARGRDLHPTEILETAPEYYLLVSWHAPTAPEIVHQHRDQFGATLRASHTERQPGT